MNITFDKLENRYMAITTESFVTAIYNLFLNRMPDPGGLSAYSGLINRNSSNIEKYIEITLTCDEYINNIKNKGTYFTNNVNISMRELIDFMNKAKTNRELLRYVIVEYLFYLRKYRKAFKIYRTVNNNKFLYFHFRVLYFADQINYLEYIWQLNKLYNNFSFISGNEFLSSANIYQYKDNFDIDSFQSSFNVLEDIRFSSFYDNINIYTKEQIINIVKNSCGLRNIPGKIIYKIIAIINDILNLPIITPSKQNPLPSIFIGGFFYSGSSAVYDYLRDSNELLDTFASRLFPTDKLEKEIGIFHWHYGIWDIYDKFLKEPDNSHQDKYFQYYLLIFLLRNCLSFFMAKNDDDWNSKIQYSLISAFCRDEDKFIKYLELIHSYIMTLIYLYKINIDITLLQNSTAHFLQSLSYILCPFKDKKYAIFNNNFNVDAIRCINLLPEGTIYIFSVRDPRDLLISWDLYSNNKITNYENSCNLYKSLLLKVLNYYNKYKNYYRFIPVSFERMILDPNYGLTLLNKLGLNKDYKHTFFNPDFSRTRIGKYVNFNNNDIMLKIKKHFPDLYNGNYLAQFIENIE